MSHLANVTPPESPTDHLPLGGSGDSALGGSHRLGSGIVRSADPAAGKERHPPRRLVVAHYLGYESLLRVESEARSAPGLPRQHDANIPCDGPCDVRPTRIAANLSHTPFTVDIKGTVRDQGGVG